MKTIPKAKSPRGNLAADLVGAMREAAGHARGEVDGLIIHRVTPTDIKAARQRLGMSQASFALLLGTPLPTLRKWEQGQRSPSGAARALLRVIDREPAAALRALEAR